MPVEAWQIFDCYKVLGVTSSAGPEDIRRAYYHTSRRTHPDAGGSHEVQVRVNQAYEVLSDPVSRQAHDLFWYQGRPTSSPPTGGRDASTHGSRPRGRREGAASSPGPVSTGSLNSLLRRVRNRIEEEQQRIRADLNSRIASTISAYEQKYADARSARQTRLVVSLALSSVAYLASVNGFHIVWLGAGIAWLSFASVATGVQIASRRIQFRDSSWKTVIRQIATDTVTAAGKDAETRVERHIGSVASISELLTRLSTFEDTEDQIARRITATLFLMGYMPLTYDRQNRILVFTDGEERLLIRYRHRTGPATNVTYVERMVKAMSQHGARRGLLFCTPGLSGNGAAMAAAQHIKWYSLEDMNHWIRQTLHANYAGPSGNILANLDNLSTFLNAISLPLPFRRRW